MTLIVLLILAGVSLSAVFSEKGIFSKAEKAGNRYNEAKAREVLETVLLADGQYEKHSNPKYNQDDFLNELIKKEIEGVEIKGDVAIIDGWAFLLDRSVPKIGKPLGRAEDLIFPTVKVSEAELATDYRTASFIVTAIEEANGIKKIEIWLNGEKIEKLDKTYNNVKEEIEQEFTVNKNGVYTVKVYGKLMASATVEVTGIVPAVEFTPNGNTDWKKEHQTKITVKTNETITGMKYLWTTSGTNPPEISDFNNAEPCTNNSTITGGNDTMTGTYYLWVILTIGTDENQKTNICGSEGFNFDNEGPDISDFTYNIISPTNFSLSCSAFDSFSGIDRYEIYADNNVIKKIKTDENICTTETFEEVTNTDMNYEIKVYDVCGNVSFSNLTNKEKIVIWKRFELLQETKFYKTDNVLSTGYILSSDIRNVTSWSSDSTIITLNNSWTFENPREETNIEDLLKNGKTNFPIFINYGGTFRQLHFWKYENGAYRINYTNYRVDSSITYFKGEFVRFENYAISGEQPTEGKYNDGYYERIETVSSN